MINPLLNKIGRGLIAPGLAVFMLAAPAGAAELPKDPDRMVGMIREAIETHNYDMLAGLVFWKDTGKIKKRIVRFHLNRSIGRKIKSITWEDFPANGMDGILATGKLAPNMEVTHRVRVVYDERPIEKTGELPTSVFLVGRRDGVWRIGLVNRVGIDDDDD